MKNDHEVALCLCSALSYNTHTTEITHFSIYRVCHRGCTCFSYLLFSSIHSSKYDERQAVSDQREWRSAVVGDCDERRGRAGPFFVEILVHSRAASCSRNRRHYRLTHTASATHSRNEVA